MATGVKPEAPPLSDGQPSGKCVTEVEAIAMFLQVLLWLKSPYEFQRKRAQELLPGLMSTLEGAGLEVDFMIGG